MWSPKGATLRVIRCPTLQVSQFLFPGQRSDTFLTDHVLPFCSVVLKKREMFLSTNFPAYIAQNLIPVSQCSTPATVREIKAHLCHSSKIHISIIFPYTSRHKIPYHSTPPTKHLCVCTYIYIYIYIYIYTLHSTGPVHLTLFDLFTIIKTGIPHHNKDSIPLLSYVQIFSSAFTLK